MMRRERKRPPVTVAIPANEWCALTAWITPKRTKVYVGDRLVANVKHARSRIRFEVAS